MREIEREQLIADLKRLGSRSKVAKEYGMSPSTLFDHMGRLGVDSPHPRSRSTKAGGKSAPKGHLVTGEMKPGLTMANGEATIVLPKTTNPPLPDGLRDDVQVLVDHRLDPKRFRIKVYTDNWWDGPTEGGTTRFYQSKVVAEIRPMAEDFPIVFEPTWHPPKPRARRKVGQPSLVPLFSDPHFPLHEPALYEGSLSFLDEHRDRISELLIPGDEGDWTPFSRWGVNRRINVSVKEAQYGVYEGLAGWRGALPDAPIKILPGNHTHWLVKRMGEVMPGALDLQRPGEDFGLLSLRSVVNLDSLHIEYLDTEGEYHDVIYEIAPGLVAMHGTATGEHGGATKEIKVWEQASVMQGHDHSGQLTVICKRLPTGGYVQHYAVSMLAMSRKDLGYSSKHNVAQGFPVVGVWPDGRFHIDLAFYNPETGETTWRDWRYRP